MNTKFKKGRNVGAVDSWLDSIGLYRKNVAYDETCLFRAVSEQLFQSQIYHERVRKECVDYGRKHFYEFWYQMDTEEDWYEHLDLLKKHMVFCGNIEIQILSLKYQRDIILFDAAQQEVVNATNKGFERTLMLCKMNEDHFDVVYNKEHIQNAGFCQSIVYNVLYERVFGVENVEDIVQGMLYKKEFASTASGEVNNNSEEVKDDSDKSVEATFPTPPFPFKVAKALDPSIYRNIEYDSWTEVRREMRLGEWYYGDDNLILGTRCILNENNKTFECYIQEILKNENKCVVYVTKLAQKLTVDYKALSPEDDAKPWPLPYRFAKNLVVSTPNQAPEKTLKPPKKRKDKRRIKQNSESSIQSQAVPRNDSPERDIKAFIGAPLQMHTENAYPQEPPPETNPQTPHSQHNLLLTPEIASPMPKFQWDFPWNNYTPGSAQSGWSGSVTTPNANYPNKPMVASAPVTPDVIPYHGSRYPFYVNYNYSPYNNSSWTSSSEYSPPHTDSNEIIEDNIDNNQASSSYSDAYEAQALGERPTFCSLAPPSPQIEVFSPVIPVHPGTPVIYASGPEVPEMMVQSPYPVQWQYTPPVDVQYVPTGQFIYTPTPPAGWYPPGITSQGFTFPTPNQNLSK